MSSHQTELARQQILQSSDLDTQRIETTLGQLLSGGVDAGDLYFQSRQSEYWYLEDGLVKDAGHAQDRGVGVRAIRGESVGFAYSEALFAHALESAVGSARAIARQGGVDQGADKIAKDNRPRSLYPTDNPATSLDEQGKLALLRKADQAARAADPRVSQVMVSLTCAHDAIMVVSAQAGMAGDIRPMLRMNVNVIVEQDGRREQGSAGGGGRHQMDFLLAPDRVEGYAREAVRIALVRLDAIDAPAGEMTVVLGPGWPGVLLHEAVGHGLEGDFNRKGSSAYSGRMGEQVASPLCTIVDDGTLDGRRGSLNMDDEGVNSQCTTLIENGILKGYMQDRHNARLMNVPTTGNGRRESFAHLPMPRMTNTYMLAGESDPQEIIASVSDGLYAVGFEGGQVDITSGQFVFSASEAYLIKDGKVGAPVKGATLIGNGPKVLQQVSMVGNDLALDPGIGVCGKDGQSVPVGVGQPTLKIDRLTVGGTQTG